MIKKTVILFIASTLFSACFEGSPDKKGKTTVSGKKEVPTADYSDFTGSVFNIDTYDDDRILEAGCGFFVGDSMAVTKYSFFHFANRAEIVPLNSTRKYRVEGFLAVDRINDLILLKINGYNAQPIPLHTEKLTGGIKTILISRSVKNVLPLRKGKYLGEIKHAGNNFLKITNNISSKKYGTPVFVNRKVIGLGFSDVVDFDNTNLATPSAYIVSLMKKAGKLQQLKNLQENPLETGEKIKGILIETDVGNIKIRLLDETPAYRNNFIRLVKENYYDSLLIHRVIRGFGIQSGAADTRYAAKDDVVGWKGPGYTLPAHIHPAFFHQRGMIGSPRKPDTKNRKRRSDGSQFYIVSGRIYTDEELDEIEKENNYKFSSKQRQLYKTIGGAPHLDGSYTIFGKVVEGMDVVDAISLTPVNHDYRPLRDFRIVRMKLLK